MPSATVSTAVQAVVHPLVLLSVVDHYNRVVGPHSLTSTNINLNNATSGQHGSIFEVMRVKRVLGVLLGMYQPSSSAVQITNSFALPFDEDEKNSNVWFLDHNFLENMADLFKKVNTKEKIVGWYHTGPKMRSSDLAIHEVFKKYTLHPILVVIDVEPKALGIPTEAYMAVEQQEGHSGGSSWSFAHVPSMIDADESEEIGVEHLLRDLRDHSMALVQQSTVSSGAKPTSSHVGEVAISAVPLSLKINNMISSLASFSAQLHTIQLYLGKVASGLYPLNEEILALLQEIMFHLVLDLDPEWHHAHLTHANDQAAIVYVSCLIRSILSLHTLIQNKLENREAERKLDEQLAQAEKPPVSLVPVLIGNNVPFADASSS